MIFVQCAQGTEEWHAARAGVVTASTFSDALEVLKRASGDKKPGDPSSASDKLAIATAIERISGKPYGDTFQTFAMKRGSEQEAYARMRYEARCTAFVDEAGIVLTDDRMFGYSTDGFVGSEGMIEIKVPLDPIKVLSIIETGDISEYKHQIQGGLWITGRKWCDFCLGIPDLAGLGNGNELYVQRVNRDDNFIEEMESGLIKFVSRVRRIEATLRAPFKVA